MEDGDTLIALLTSKVDDFTTEGGASINDLSEDAFTVLSADAKLDTVSGVTDIVLFLTRKVCLLIVSCVDF